MSVVAPGALLPCSDCECEWLTEPTSRALGEVSKGLFSLILAEAVFLILRPAGVRLRRLTAKEQMQPRLTSKDTQPKMPAQEKKGYASQCSVVRGMSNPHARYLDHQGLLYN